MGFGKFLATVGGGIVGFVGSGGNPVGALLGAKGGADFAQRKIDEKNALAVAQQQASLGQQTLERGDLIAQQQLDASQQAQQQFQPFQLAGEQALAESQALLGFGTPEQVEAARGRVTDNPAFQFALQQGEKGIERAASARGRLNSGRTLLQLRDQNAALSAGAFNQRLGSLSAPIQQGFGASQGIANLQTGGAARAGQFQTQAGAQNVALQDAGFQSQLAGQQAGGGALDSLLSSVGFGFGSGIFKDKPGQQTANIQKSQGVPNQAPGIDPRAAPAVANRSGFPQGGTGVDVPAPFAGSGPTAGFGAGGIGIGAGGFGPQTFMGLSQTPQDPRLPAPGFGSPTFAGQQTGFPVARRF